MSDERVSIDVAGHVARVMLNRPDKHNALDLPMFHAIVDTARRLAAEPGIRAIVLHGAGKSFCSGLDVVAVMSDGEALTKPLHDPPPNLLQQSAYEWIRAPMPVIAAIHGNCLGGGLQIALGADIRIAAPDARLSMLEIRWGLIPDMAITRTLPRLVGLDVAKELAFTGRMLSGAEAHALGIVTHLSDDPLAAALTLAAEIAERSPDAVRRAKRLFQEGWAGSPEETMALEARLQLEIAGGPNQLAAAAAGRAKQPAEFIDPVDSVER
jgi:enoyl-CoA hydratase/carnithine racemase